MKQPSASQNTAGLPPWAANLIAQYESTAANQFILHGNVNDLMVLPLAAGKVELGTLSDFLLRVLLPRFDVVITYDLGNGIRLEKGGAIFAQWPTAREKAELPKSPRAAIDTLTHYFRYSANLAQLGQARHHIGCIIRNANMLAPAVSGSFINDLDALTLLMRDWSTDSALTRFPLATFLLAENLHDLHPLLANNSHAARIKIPLPGVEELQQLLALTAPQYPVALREYCHQPALLAAQFTGATVNAVVGLLKTNEYAHQPIVRDDLLQLKKTLVEHDSAGLIEFLEPTRTLDDLYGQQKIKDWLRQDIALWAQHDLQAMPMGYLLCGPVGTGKTFMIECLAGEAGVPIVKLKNFRDRWVGSSEGNLEKIFRLLHALGRCFVFIDEADQALGKRDAGSGDSGLSGRIYSMIAEEMGNTGNRGKILWVLASSRPDLIEVDLKRPGRIDVKIPIFPTTSARESFSLLQALATRRGLLLPDMLYRKVRARMPILLTPGAAEAIAVKIYRATRTTGQTPEQALLASLADYQHPVPHDIMEFQLQLAIQEASDRDFIPAALRPES